MRIVVAGCGFAGLETALDIKKAAGDQADVTVIDKKDTFTFTPWINRLFRGEDKKNISFELAPFLSSREIKFMNNSLRTIDLDSKSVSLSNAKFDFDFLVLALGHVIDYQGIPGAEENSLTYTSAEDAERIMERIKQSLKEAASSQSAANDKEREKLLTIAVLGGTTAGVCLAGEISDYLEACCAEHGVRRIDVKIIVLEPSSHILGSYPQNVREAITDYLSRQGIHVRTGASVDRIEKDAVKMKGGKLDAGTIIWCGGYKTNPLVQELGLKTDTGGRLLVNSYFQSTSEATIYAVGNCASVWNVKPETPESAGAWSVLRQAKVAAHNLATNVVGGNKKEYTHSSLPIILDLGRNYTLLVKNGVAFRGGPAEIYRKIREKKWWHGKR